MSEVLAPLVLVDRDEVLGDCMRSNVYVNPDGIQTKAKLVVAIEDVPRHPQAPKVFGKTAIPAGTYPLAFAAQSKFAGWFYTHNDRDLITKKDWEFMGPTQRAEYHQHQVIWVQDVPGFGEIRHHWGNTALDTEGCLVVGTSRGKLGASNAVLGSVGAYIRYYAAVAPLIRKALDAGTHALITYRDSFPPSKLVGAPAAA